MVRRGGRLAIGWAAARQQVVLLLDELVKFRFHLLPEFCHVSMHALELARFRVELLLQGRQLGLPLIKLRAALFEGGSARVDFGLPRLDLRRPGVHFLAAVSNELLLVA